MFYLQLPVASETLLDSKSWKWAYSSPVKLRKFANLNMPANFLLKISYEWAKNPQFDLASNHFYFFFRCFTGTRSKPPWMALRTCHSEFGRLEMFYLQLPVASETLLDSKSWKWSYSSPLKLRKFANLNMPANFLLKTSYEWAKKSQFDLASNHFYFFSDVLLAHAPNLPEWHSALVIQSLEGWKCFICNFRLPLKRCLTLSPENKATRAPWSSGSLLI